MAAPESKTLTASCHCRNANFSLTIPKSDLPLKVHVCHCSICRQTHGALCSFHGPVPSGIEPQFIAPSGLEKLTGYAHPYSQSTRYFCTNCGCHIGDRDHDNGDWYISVSVFDANANEGLWEIGSHAFTNSTRDGGMSELIPQIRGQTVKVWNPQESPASEELPVVPASEDDQLLAQCHCGGVSMTISRPHRDYPVGSAGRKWGLSLAHWYPRDCVDIGSDGPHLAVATRRPSDRVFEKLLVQRRDSRFVLRDLWCNRVS
ncbi:hypothetical protein Aspvir_003605 [Aspergillus viridinutans]|uniref:CENP-V/GFA domain-containing protein n=1 Tax=Aspergillus viridinutans TaxID=75553 RepID=A0A9P3F2I0_ASPVI|nr:uncharacterized protein Aspvir_003605 [Aspergillus viridinutans]GIJ99604.1 hypothetical protein Aspvir_003605 [Aspergillus viridinutans]